MRALTLVVGIAAIVSGCGGTSGAGKTLTISAPPVSAAPGSGLQGQLDAYLSTLHPLAVQGKASINDAKPALAAFGKDPTQANATASADQLAAAAKKLNGMFPG